MGAVLKKELKNYFLSPIGYIVIGIFFIIFSAFFYITVIENSVIDLTYLFYNVAFFGLMFMIPLITMNTFSGERKSGTEQILLTSPVSMVGVVVAKFLAALCLVIIPLLSTLMYFGILCFFGKPNIPIYLTSLLGFLLVSCVYISFGIMASSLTESSIISGILTFAFIILVSICGNFVKVLAKISFIDKYINFLYGQLDISTIIRYITTTILFMSITMILMQRRKSIK